MSSNRDLKPQRRGALGKGLNSLLGLGPEATDDLGESSATAGATKANMVLKVKVDEIEPNPHQPRKFMEKDALASLAKSVIEDGILQPLIVARAERPGRYTLVAGERRWRAAQIAGLEEVPVIVKDIASDDMLRIALIENVQRADLNIIEEAEAYAALINDYGLTQDQCAKRIGKDRSTITNILRLLTLPQEIQGDMSAERLTMGHGRALLSLEDKKHILRVRDIVVKKGLNVRQTEQLCKRLKSGGPEKAQGSLQGTADLDYLAESLRSHLRTKVKLMGSGTRGKIEISYFSVAELERIIGIISPGRL